MFWSESEIGRYEKKLTGEIHLKCDVKEIDKKCHS